jgi:hypothetical protein
VQVADLGPDAAAQQLQLSAVVRTGKGIVEVLPVDGGFDRNARLVLALHHPARAELDRDIALLPMKTGWRSDGEIDLTHDWNVELRPADGAWRLRGRWSSGQQATYLRPALAGE